MIKLRNAEKDDAQVFGTSETESKAGGKNYKRLSQGVVDALGKEGG